MLEKGLQYQHYQVYDIAPPGTPHVDLLTLFIALANYTGTPVFLGKRDCLDTLLCLSCMCVGKYVEYIDATVVYVYKHISV